ncbi:MAG: hypothetical protein LUQ41_06540 [Methanomicrobiales archaeon]|nr:hypothetical protein [Methanomicrobiales archaeon]
MSSEENDPYQRAGLVLILAAMLFLILAFLGAGGPVAPALIVSSLGLFLTGILLLTFSRGQTPDPAVLSLLAVQHQLNTATLLSRAGCRDPPLFIPFAELDGRVAQFHALPPEAPPCPDTGAASASHRGAPGILLPPACLPLLRELEARFHLRIPADPGRIPQVIREVAEEILEIAARVGAAVEGEEVRVDLLGFTLYPGCRAAREASPDACLQNPCTICSLLACVAVRATGRECRIVSVDLDDRSESVHLVISFRAPVREKPAVPAPVVSISPVPAEPVFHVPVEPVSLIPEELVVRAMEEPATPIPEEPVSPSMEDLVKRAMEGLVSPSVEEPDSPVPKEPVIPMAEELTAPVPAEPVTPMAEEPVREQPVIPVPEVSEVPVWWSRHPGSRRLRYLR